MDLTTPKTYARSGTAGPEGTRPEDLKPAPRPGFSPWNAILVILLAAGAVTIALRFGRGLAVTNLTSITPWGAWVAFYIYFVGLSAGAFLLSTLTYVFGMERFEKVGRTALATAILSMVVALTFVLIDLGHAERFWAALLYWNPTSVLAWEVHSYVLYIALLTVELYYSMRPDLIRRATGSGWEARLCRRLTFGSRDLSEASVRRDRRMLRILGAIGIPLAIFGVHGGTGAIFAVVEARPFWNSGLFPVIFVVSALVSGTALLTVTYVLGNRARGQEPDRELVISLSRLWGAFLLVDLGLQFWEFLVGAYRLEHLESAVLESLFVGKFAWSFWLIQIGLGAVAPLIILYHPRTRDSISRLATAAGLVLVGILAVRFNIVIPALVVPVMEGLPVGRYYPSLIEWVSSAGIVAMGILLYQLAARALPLELAEEAETAVGRRTGGTESLMGRGRTEPSIGRETESEVASS